MTSTGNEQSELFRSMTDVAKEACRAAHNTLQILCDQVVSGVVTLSDMKFLKQNEGRFNELCTAARIRSFSLKGWLDNIEYIEQHIERVQQYHSLLDSSVQGIYIERSHVN